MAKPTSFSSIILNLTSLGITGDQLYLNGQSSLVYNTGTQTISGAKTFSNGIRTNKISGLSNAISIDFSQSALTNLQSGVVLDWAGGKLYNGATISPRLRISYASGGSDHGKIFNQTGYAVIFWDEQLLLSPSEGTTIDWINKKLYSYGAERIVWGDNAAIYDEYAYPVMSFNASSRDLYDFSGNASVSFATRYLYDRVGDVALLYGDRVLSGNWKTNTIPTQSGHLINYNFATGSGITKNPTSVPPSNTGVAAAWTTTIISGITYKIPLYL